MFKSPYSTTIGKSYNLQMILGGLRSAEIDDALTTVDGISLVMPSEKTLSPFKQPILQVDAPHLNSKAILDARAYMKVNTPVPLKEDVYRFNLMYAKLSYIWSLGSNAHVRASLMSHNLHVRIFGQWLAGELSRRLNLDPAQYAKLRLMFTIHYIQMADDRLMKDSGKDAQITIVSKASRSIPGSSPILAYQSLGEDVPYLSNLEDTVVWIKKVIDSPSISQLNSGLVYTVINTSTFASLTETLAISVEYPPAFMVLVYAALTERGVNKTQLGRMVAQLRDRQTEQQFIRIIQQVIEEES